MFRFTVDNNWQRYMYRNCLQSVKSNLPKFYDFLRLEITILLLSTISNNNLTTFADLFYKNDKDGCKCKNV